MKLRLVDKIALAVACSVWVAGFAVLIASAVKA